MEAFKRGGPAEVRKQQKEPLLHAARGVPKNPSTQHLRFQIPKTIYGTDFGTRYLRYWILGPKGSKHAGFSYSKGPSTRI